MPVTREPPPGSSLTLPVSSLVYQTDRHTYRHVIVYICKTYKAIDSNTNTFTYVRREEKRREEKRREEKRREEKRREERRRERKRKRKRKRKRTRKREGDKEEREWRERESGERERG